MTEGLVSIITPCYNGAKYIEETILSVKNQTYADWEMLIVDDGSEDESEAIIRKYADNDDRIKYIYQNNGGSASARNNGIAKAEGQFIALLDADDIWLPTFLESQIDFLKNRGAVCVASSYGQIDNNSNDLNKDTIVKSTITKKDMRIRNHIGCLTGLYDSSKYGKIYLHEELRSMRDDYAYWYDIVSLEGKAYGNQEILAKYRVLKTSTTGNKRKLILKQYRFYRDYLNENRAEAFVNVIRWGIAGLRKYY